MSLDPRFDPPTKEKFDTESFTDEIFNEAGESFPAKIDYEFCDYGQGAIHIFSLKVETSLTHVVLDDVMDLIRLRERKNVILECQLTLV